MDYDKIVEEAKKAIKDYSIKLFPQSFAGKS